MLGKGWDLIRNFNMFAYIYIIYSKGAHAFKSVTM